MHKTPLLAEAGWRARGLPGRSDQTVNSGPTTSTASAPAPRVEYRALCRAASEAPR